MFLRLFWILVFLSPLQTSCFQQGGNSGDTGNEQLNVGQGSDTLPNERRRERYVQKYAFKKKILNCEDEHAELSMEYTGRLLPIPSYRPEVVEGWKERFEAGSDGLRVRMEGVGTNYLPAMRVKLKIKKVSEKIQQKPEEKTLDAETQKEILGTYEWEDTTFSNNTENRFFRLYMWGSMFEAPMPRVPNPPVEQMQFLRDLFYTDESADPVNVNRGKATVVFTDSADDSNVAIRIERIGNCTANLSFNEQRAHSCFSKFRSVSKGRCDKYIRTEDEEKKTLRF